MTMHEPLHPGIIVREALIEGTGLSVTEAAEKLGVTRTTLSRLLNCHSSLSPEMALRLSQFFKTSIELWVNLQAQYDVWLIQQQAKEIKIKPFEKAA